MNVNKYTPIKDRKTGKPIKLGDLCENEKGYIGVLSWCDYLNRYILKSESGGNLHSRTYTKVKANNSKNNIDSTRVECRTNHLKKKW